MAIPKNEERCVTFVDTGYVITRNKNNGVFHLYKMKNDDYIHIKQRSSDPFFKETYPERYQPQKKNEYQL